MSTLAEKLYGLAQQATGYGESTPIEVLHSWPPLPAGRHLNEFEIDLTDWGFLFGAGYAIARAEDPYATTEELAARTLAAAQEAHAQWAGDDAWRAHYEAAHGDEEMTA